MIHPLLISVFTIFSYLYWCHKLLFFHFLYIEPLASFSCHPCLLISIQQTCLESFYLQYSTAFYLASTLWFLYHSNNWSNQLLQVEYDDYCPFLFFSIPRMISIPHHFWHIFQAPDSFAFSHSTFITYCVFLLLSLGMSLTYLGMSLRRLRCLPSMRPFKVRQ